MSMMPPESGPPMAGAPAGPPPPEVMAAADVLARYVGNDQAMAIAGEVVDAIMQASQPQGPAPMPSPEQVGSRFPGA